MRWEWVVGPAVPIKVIARHDTNQRHPLPDRDERRRRGNGALPTCRPRGWSCGRAHGRILRRAAPSAASAPPTSRIRRTCGRLDSRLCRRSSDDSPRLHRRGAVPLCRACLSAKWRCHSIASAASRLVSGARRGESVRMRGCRQPGRSTLLRQPGGISVQEILVRVGRHWGSPRLRLTLKQRAGRGTAAQWNIRMSWPNQSLQRTGAPARLRRQAMPRTGAPVAELGRSAAEERSAR